MHVSTALVKIKKQGIFKAHAEAHAHALKVEQRQLAKQAKAALAELSAATSKDKRTSKKASQKTKEGAALAGASDAKLLVIYQKVLEKAKEAVETAEGKEVSAAKVMFRFYLNWLSADMKYTWNKIVKEQMEADPYKDLQGVSKKGPRGLLCKSFDDCVMFHLLTLFPNNAAEQEKYYLSNVLKKPQQVGICQFEQCVEQLNAYVAQLPCWYYSPSHNPGMIPANVPFTKADQASHALQMCSHLWQDQYNLHKNGMTPVDMHLLLTSLEAIEWVCRQEKANALSNKKASTKSKTGTKQPSTGYTNKVPKKVRFKKHCKLCKKHGGAHTTYATKDCCNYENDGSVKPNFCTAKKAGKKTNPAKQSFAQLSEKLDKLEKSLKQASLKSKKCHRDNSDSNSI
jgi:hypothetical protein